MTEARWASLETPGGARLETLGDGIRMTVDGWMDSAEVVNNRSSLLISPGDISTSIHRGARQLTLNILATDLPLEKVDAEARTIRGLWPDEEALGQLTVEDCDGLRLTADVRLDGRIKLETHAPFGWLRAQVPLVSESPYLYGPPQTYQLPSVSDGVGLRWPLFTNDDAEDTGGGLYFGEKADSLGLAILNRGSAPAYPTFRVSTDDGSGFRLKDSTGRVVQWVGGCSPLAPVEVDMRGSVRIRGVDRTAQLTRRDWISIPPGGSLSVSLETLQGRPGSSQVDIRDTYI